MSALAPKRMVLVVEDGRDVREAITEILVDSDYEAPPSSASPARPAR